MFQYRSREFDPHIGPIAGQLRAIERELGRVGQSAGRRTVAHATTAGNQIADAIVPILNEIIDRFGRGQRVAVDEAASFGSEAVKIGTKIGSNALEQVATQTKKRPLVILAVAIGVGILIGMASRRT
jgi:predicted trehalose synthase